MTKSLKMQGKMGADCLIENQSVAARPGLSRAAIDEVAAVVARRLDPRGGVRRAECLPLAPTPYIISGIR